MRSSFFQVSLCLMALALFSVSSCFPVGSAVSAPRRNAAASRLSSRMPFSHQETCKNAKQSSILSLRGGGDASSSTTSALRAVMVDAIAVVNNFYMSSPYLAAALTCGTKASAADYVAQRRHIKKRGETVDANTDEDDDSLDFLRNVAFLVYGAMYQGMAQEYVYNHLYPVWFGTDTTPAVVLSKVLFDLLIQTTLVTLPIAYLTKAVIFRYSFAEGMSRYWQDITTNGLLTKYFMLWGPVQCITFSIIPEHLRVSFIAVVSFFWLIILSSISARPRSKQMDIRGGGGVAAAQAQCELKDGATCNIDG